MNVDPASGQPACTVTVLNNSPERYFTAKILVLQDRWITLESPEDMPRQGVFKISWQKYIALAEIVTSQKEGSSLVLRIRHFLQTDDIEEMRRQWM